MKRLASKIVKITLAVVFSLLLIAFTLPILFPGPVINKVKTWTNQNIEGELEFTKLRLSFFDHFPSLTATLHNVSLKGSAPFKTDTLLAAKEISLGINISKLIWEGSIHIDKAFASQAFFNILINKKGESNYNVYKSTNNNTKKSTSSGSLQLEKIQISDARINYDDLSIGVLLTAKGFNYEGKGDLSKEIFDLKSKARIASFTFLMDKQPYLENKNINAELVTRINTHSLAFFFDKNDLFINKLPVQFNGMLDFLPNGYNIDFSISSKGTTLEQLVSAFPPAYLGWSHKTKLLGKCNMLLAIKGKYIAATATAPDVTLNMSVRDGFVQHQGAPFPASDISFILNAHLPGLNFDNSTLNVDSLNFSAGSNYAKGKFTMHNFTKPSLQADVHTQLNLDEIDRVLGLEKTISGHMQSDILVTGNRYNINAKGKMVFATKYESNKANGAIEADLRLKGLQDDVAKGNYTALEQSGMLALKNVRIKTGYLPKNIFLANARFDFDDDKISFSNVEGNYSESDLLLAGYLQNLVGYVVFPDAILKGNLNLKSKVINVNEFMVTETAAANPVAGSGGAIQVPPVYNLRITADAKLVRFKDMLLQNVQGSLLIDSGAIALDQTSFNIIGCTASMKALYKTRGHSAPTFDYHIKAVDFDIKKAYDSISLFRELASAAQYAQGIVSLDYDLKGVLNNNMEPIFPSLEGGGTIYLKDVKIKGHKLFAAVSKQTGRDSVDNPSLKKVTIKSTIKNNIINLERFKFRVFGFRPRIEGQTSFDGALNLKMRLGLPPLGIIGIPIKITGTQDEPVIKLGRKTEDLEETRFEGEVN